MGGMGILAFMRLNVGVGEVGSARARSGWLADALLRACIEWPSAVPMQLISRIDSRSTRCIRRISAHCSTPTTPSSSLDHSDQARLRTRPDDPDPAPGGP